jgi:hypothetical protein
MGGSTSERADLRKAPAFTCDGLTPGCWADVATAAGEPSAELSTASSDCFNGVGRPGVVLGNKSEQQRLYRVWNTAHELLA